MKTIRNFVMLFGFSLMLASFGAAGARAQGFTMTDIGGSFSLPRQAQWGAMTLPAGTYKLQYGYAPSGLPVVRVRSTDHRGPQGVLFAQALNRISGTNNEIMCVREGETLVVEGVELAAVGEAAIFAIPRRTKLMVQKGSHDGYKQLAEAPMLIQRIPVAINAK